MLVGGLICLGTLSATNPVGWALIGVGLTVTMGWLTYKAGSWVVKKVRGKKSKTQVQIDKAKERLMRALQSESPKERSESKAILKALGVLGGKVTAQCLLDNPKHAHALIETRLQGASSWSI